ncbi:MAG: hypothetical protein H0X51_00220 [Parachlamydiaceae bacterium]|nr:hypothetical protein [Parachlamydiaceae bacterium]
MTSTIGSSRNFQLTVCAIQNDLEGAQKLLLQSADPHEDLINNESDMKELAEQLSHYSPRVAQATGRACNGLEFACAAGSDSVIKLFLEKTKFQTPKSSPFRLPLMNLLCCHDIKRLDSGSQKPREVSTAIFDAIYFRAPVRFNRFSRTDPHTPFDYLVLAGNIPLLRHAFLSEKPTEKIMQQAVKHAALVGNFELLSFLLDHVGNQIPIYDETRNLTNERFPIPEASKRFLSEYSKMKAAESDAAFQRTGGFVFGLSSNFTLSDEKTQALFQSGAGRGSGTGHADSSKEGFVFGRSVFGSGNASAAAARAESSAEVKQAAAQRAPVVPPSPRIRPQQPRATIPQMMPMLQSRGSSDSVISPPKQKKEENSFLGKRHREGDDDQNPAVKKRGKQGPDAESDTIIRRPYEA